MLQSSSFRCTLFAACLALLLWTGCDNTLDPFSDRAAYSIHGYLSLDAPRQVIRVKSLSDPLLPGSTQTLDATVTLENLTSGTSATLRDSVIRFDDTYTHNFWTDMPLQPDTPYRITVERSDGATSQAEATTPIVSEAQPTPTQGNCRTFFTVTFPGMQKQTHVLASIGFRLEDGQRYWFDQHTSTDHTNVQVRFSPGSVMANVMKPIDDPTTCFTYEPRCMRLFTDEMYVAYTHLGPDWFSSFPDENLTYDPTESYDVENGLGFFGALRRDTLTIPVDTVGIPSEERLCD